MKGSLFLFSPAALPKEDLGGLHRRLLLHPGLWLLCEYAHSFQGARLGGLFRAAATAAAAAGHIFSAEGNIHTVVCPGGDEKKLLPKLESHVVRHAR